MCAKKAENLKRLSQATVGRGLAKALEKGAIGL